MRKLSPDRVREARERAWLSQQDTADASGVSLFTVQRIERGDGAVRPGTARAIAKALGVTPDDLADAPKVEPPRDRPVEPSAGASLLGERRNLLEERRLLSSLNPFATRVEKQAEYWRELADLDQVSLHTLEYATKELEFTALSFKVLADAAIAEHWSGAELRLLGRVYESVAGPYKQAWDELLAAWVGEAGAADTQGSRRLRLVADEAMQVVEEAEEAVRTAA